MLIVEKKPFKNGKKVIDESMVKNIKALPYQFR